MGPEEGALTTYTRHWYPHFFLPIRTMLASIKAYLAGRYMSVAKADTILVSTTTESKRAKVR